MKEKTDRLKEFFATSWAIDNKTSIYVLAVFITALGLLSYFNIPKEQFPEIVIPTIIINTAYPGTSPEDMENLVTRPIEKQCKSLADVKEITSNSVQDFSSIVVEFNPGIEVSEAKQRVRDAVDKSKSTLPNNLPKDPDIKEVDISEVPIMFINLSGDYDLQRLKEYAEDAQDKIETLKEITRVDIVGSLEREIQIDVDMYKMQAASVSFRDIESAVASENVTVSAGTITSFGTKYTIRLAGQFKSPEQIKNIILKSSSGAIVYIQDIAEVRDGFKEQESFARLDGKNVITLNVIKKSGENLLNASREIKEIMENMKTNYYPPDLSITLTGDQSRFTKSTLEELNNTIVIGFIMVVLVLMFFMGFNNAFFVGLSVPLSMFMAYLIMPGLGFTMNMIVMFGFIFALGIIVDDAIVVIENTHRLHRYETDIVKAAKHAAGEVFLPILSGTLTTLAPFFPLAFWPGVVGKFMYYLPVTLILTLFASLFVAYIINPVFAVSFMKHEYDQTDHRTDRKRLLIISVLLGVLALISYLAGGFAIGNVFMLALILNLLYRIVLKKAILKFQNDLWPWIMHMYEKTLLIALKGKNPWYLLIGVIIMFFASIMMIGLVKPQVRFFPDNKPGYIYVFIKLPEGTDQRVTDSVTHLVERKVHSILGEKNPIVESVITNVGLGAGESMFDRSVSSNKGKITVNFVESRYRQGISTQTYMDSMRKELKSFPGVTVTVDKNKMGPPTGKPVNIEITGEDLDELIVTATKFKSYLDSINIPGIEQLKSDFENNKPEIIINIDRVRANREGLSLGQIGMEMRTAIYGKEISKYKEEEDEYPIQLRFSEEERTNINQIINSRITYRDMNSGQLRQIPISSVASIQYKDTYGGIKRKNLKRVITLSSEVLSGHTANEIVLAINKAIPAFEKPRGIEISLTGEQEDQADTMAFLAKAMLIAIGLIFFILITQFGSLSKSLIILSEVLFSIIGVLFGIAVFGMSISIMMTGLGIVALGGIVVRNGILIVEFCDELKQRGMKSKEAIIQAGKTRITPVVLTATATILGLVPLAIGMNIDFVSLFTHLNPHIYFGGDNAMFWGPLSWTIIFGLSFATFLTLVFVPAMVLIDTKMKIRWKRKKSNPKKNWWS
ncbi:MAG: efflux RND transporter permease subunit [Bacteroidales bacterium]|nr:efflux RND transporter permease subunit [Bacteroidales bacterium]HNW73447.1 efflux RND transporter permease subunit [Bacteroidales bacterium]HPS49404.1 efflux RND transporter permease subunit [Bacteroidales bacterium]